MWRIMVAKMRRIVTILVHAAQDVGYVKNRHPEVTQILGDFKIRGQGRPWLRSMGQNLINLYLGCEASKMGTNCSHFSQDTLGLKPCKSRAPGLRLAPATKRAILRLLQIGETFVFSWPRPLLM